MVTKKKPTVVKKTCTRCNVAQHPIEEYYMASDDLIYANRRLPICKTCLIDIVDMSNVELVINILRKLDKPFIKEAYIACLDEKYINNPFGEYMRRMAMKDKRDLNYSDSMFGDKDKNDISKPDLSELSSLSRTKNEKLTAEELVELVDFFGEGYEEKDYVYLSSEYEDYLNRYEVDSKTLENLIKEICLTQLDIRIKRASGDKVDPQLKTLQDLLGSSNLKPVQETGNQAVEQETFGTLIKKWENERPIPEPDEAWRDVDGIRKYVQAFFLSPLTKIFGKNNPFSEETEAYLENYTVRPPDKELD